MYQRQNLIRIYLFIPAILLATVCFSQKKETYYDAQWHPCQPAQARYYSILEKTDSGYYRRDYFINGSKLQMAALYEDSDCKIMNGSAVFFYANGYPETAERYIHGKREGIAVSYHSNGIIADSGEYHNGVPVSNTFRWHPNGYMADSTALIKDSTFVHVSWFDDGSVAGAGREINGKPVGAWAFYRRNGSKAASEIYENGKRISTRHFDESGTEIPIDTSRNEHPAEFKGGVDKWRHYLEKALVWPNGYHFENTSMIALQVQMTINETGKITNVYVVNPFHPVFDKIAYDAISKGPNWIPALQHNRPVPYRFTQTVTFAEQ